jgi:TolB protein
MNRDGSNVRLFFDGPGADFFPSWSPDGSTVIFYSDESGAGDLYAVDARGGNKRRFLQDEGFPANRPAR